MEREVRDLARAGADDIEQHTSGFYALFTICTHLGCTPNYLSAENKFKCPCHGSGYRLTGVNFEGPAPRPARTREDLALRRRAGARRQEPEVPVRARPVEGSRFVSQSVGVDRM
jgi:nitrite reductase/ring-hydroxylating ferredoxin subunit